MTAEAPDPRSFKSADDAFQYPVPVVRKLEQQLRHNADDNREKLRSLVGASYRDLLGTAERIIEMDRQMQNVESTLGLIGQKCNSRRVDKISRNYSGLTEYTRKLDAERFSFAAQLAVLQTCPTVIRRALKKGSTLLAAKILVISRLLHKNLVQAPNPPPFVESLKNQLASLRRKLLHTIDKQFSRFSSETNDVLESMCAFSLATSSTPSDVLRHFHHVRLETITRLVEEGRISQDHLPRALKLYVRTLVDTQSIFPKRLADALVRLKARPLLQDPEIQAIAELNLDVHERWIADEVRNFTPWPRHDELSKSDAEKLLKTWARQAVKAFLDSTRGVLAEQRDVKTVLDVRREMLETWLSSSSRSLGVDPSQVLDDLREVINDRLRTLLTDRAKQLNIVTSSLTAVLDTWDSKSRDEVTSLWDPSTSSIDTSNGAPLFKRAIIERSHGLNESLSQLISTYDQWAQSLKDAYAVIKEMKDTKWDDDLNGDDEDEDFDLESKQALLSEDDPCSLEDSLKEALSTAFVELQKDVESLVSKTLANPEDATAPKAILIVRALREAMVSRGGDLWSPGAVGVLKKQISEESATVLSECISAIRGAADLSEKADSTSHGDENGDATNEDQENDEGANLVGEKATADGEESKKANKTASPPSADVQKDKLTHLLFDVCYLQRVFALRSTEESPLAAVEKQLQEASGVDKPALERLKKNAGDYWRKTYLLFALLL
ncbi:Vps51/Vps67 [Neofusicoccum parvum]|uniref:Vps51/Vps67 n=1 Tax=Neofusicoccum parvum TaxID=310453 RepID=A0ACB5SGX6_9PEZI|nr:Vps51/Vps67 [Neofusicoccum parvum]